MAEPIPLTTFLLSHCKYPSEAALLVLSRSTGCPRASHPRCPICYCSLVASLHRVIQVDLPSCKHLFCSECLSRHILAGYNTCPLCRAKWYDIPPGATTARSAAVEADSHVVQLREFITDIMEAIAENITDEHNNVTEGAIRAVSRLLWNFFEAEGMISDEDDAEDETSQSIATLSDAGNANTPRQDSQRRLADAAEAPQRQIEELRQIIPPSLRPIDEMAFREGQLARESDEPESGGIHSHCLSVRSEGDARLESALSKDEVGSLDRSCG